MDTPGPTLFDSKIGASNPAVRKADLARRDDKAETKNYAYRLKLSSDHSE
jgi:hypothetical protein